VIAQAKASNALDMVGPASAEPDTSAYNSFVAALHLMGIELIKVHGERMASGAASQTRFDLAVGYMLGDGTIQYRYDLAAHFLDDAGIAFGNASASVLLVASNAPTTDVACIEHFGTTSGALMVHPYLREVIASTAQRLGFPGVLLPMIKHQPREPATD
jgi:hypothetical protein